MSNPFESDELEIEMESLVNEAMDNESGAVLKVRDRHVSSSPPASSSSRRWIYITIASIALLIGVVHHHRYEIFSANTAVTDVDRLPLATITTTGKEEDDDEEEEQQLEDDKPDAIVKPKFAEPLLSELPKERDHFKHHPRYFSDTYIRRARFDRNRTFVEKWGEWTLTDEKEKLRPVIQDHVKEAPNGDLPLEEFPDNAWQRDPEYLEKFLGQSISLAERGMLAILAEMGHYTPGVDTFADATRDADKDDPAFMFNLTWYTGKVTYPKVGPGNAGWATQSWIDNLKKYLLHAIMTEGDFIVSLGGHSASAGHGNHFQQSYSLQIQRAMEPIFARLHVHHLVRNIGMGGLGTIHSALGSRSIYGEDNSLLIWDSRMTEGAMPQRDTFARQAYMNPGMVPLLLGDVDIDLYDRNAHLEVGRMNVGMWGSGVAGIPVTKTLLQVEDLPWASRFVECSREAQGLCRKYGYNGVCWIDRDDLQPAVKQKPMGGRASWHPGNFAHQLKSRFYVYNILKALREVLLEWQSMDNYTLPDEMWHLTDHFNKIREGVATFKFPGKGSGCNRVPIPNITCDIPLYGATEFTPRAHPKTTSIRYLLHPEVDYGPLPGNFYDPPDVYNPAFDPPDGDVDFVAIVESGDEFKEHHSRRRYLMNELNPPPMTHVRNSNLEPGKGWSLHVANAPDNCDGTFDSFCNRDRDSECLLYGHNDNRGTMIGDGLSGWLLMSLREVRHGFISVVMYISKPFTNPRTKGWRCVNNATTCDHPVDEESLNQKETPSCDDATFEFSIDGEVTVWTLEKFKETRWTAARNIQLSVLMNDRTFASAENPKDVELGVRVGGPCGRLFTMEISHVYWG